LTKQTARIDASELYNRREKLRLGRLHIIIFELQFGPFDASYGLGVGLTPFQWLGAIIHQLKSRIFKRVECRNCRTCFAENPCSQSASLVHHS